MGKLRFVLVAMVLAASVTAAAGESPSSNVWDRISLGTTWYLHAGYGQIGGENESAFRVGRGYLTSKYKPAKWFEGRATVDVTQDDTGDLKVRMKYLYGRLKLRQETDVFTDPFVEFGVVHGPWLDYEQHINRYRMQGKMFQERNGLFNSADIGLTAATLLGRKLPEEYRKRVSKDFAGAWGSAAIGVYNGGGYHALEKNNNKVVAGRLSLRPLTFVFPNLQTSYMYRHGRGNTAEEPLWQSHAFMVSVEHEYFVVTGTYAFGIGNQKGNKLTAAGNSMRYNGYSAFAEVKLPMVKSSIIGRYDWFDWGIKNDQAGEPVRTRVIAGYAFHFLEHNTILAEIDAVHDDVPGEDWDWLARLTLQLKFP